MVFSCRDESCKKSFSARFNRNRHEKLKAQAPETSNRQIPCDGKSGLFKCPTTDCATTSKYKYNIIKHLKSFRKFNKNKKGANENKICSFCSKVFTKISNRDRHVKNFHTHENCDNEDESSENNLYVPTMAEIPRTQYKTEATHYNQNESVTSMPQNAASSRDELEHLLSQNEVLVEDPVQSECLEPSAFFPAANSQAKHESNAEETLDPSVGAYKLPSKKSRLEAFIKKIAADIDYTDSFNRCVIDHLKLLLRDKKTAAVKGVF